MKREKRMKQTLVLQFLRVEAATNYQIKLVRTVTWKEQGVEKWDSETKGEGRDESAGESRGAWQDEWSQDAGVLIPGTVHSLARARLVARLSSLSLHYPEHPGLESRFRPFLLLGRRVTVELRLELVLSIPRRFSRFAPLYRVARQLGSGSCVQSPHGAISFPSFIFHRTLRRALVLSHFLSVRLSRFIRGLSSQRGEKSLSLFQTALIPAAASPHRDDYGFTIANCILSWGIPEFKVHWENIT